jgi:hypothetical protein
VTKCDAEGPTSREVMVAFSDAAQFMVATVRERTNKRKHRSLIILEQTMGGDFNPTKVMNPNSTRESKFSLCRNPRALCVSTPAGHCKCEHSRSDRCLKHRRGLLGLQSIQHD